MPEENKEATTVATEQGNDNSVYIEQIQQLKQNSVPKEKYEALVEEKRNLVKALAEGGQITSADHPDGESIDELRKQIFSGELNNLEYWEKTLEFRRKYKEATGKDVFIPEGFGVVVEQSDYTNAQIVEEAVQHCIDYAQGDNQAFTNELQRIMVNTGPVIRRK